MVYVCSKHSSNGSHAHHKSRMQVSQCTEKCHSIFYSYNAAWQTFLNNTPKSILFKLTTFVYHKVNLNILVTTESKFLKVQSNVALMRVVEQTRWHLVSKTVTKKLLNNHSAWGVELMNGLQRQNTVSYIVK